MSEETKDSKNPRLDISLHNEILHESPNSQGSATFADDLAIQPSPSRDDSHDAKDGVFIYFPKREASTTATHPMTANLKRDASTAFNDEAIPTEMRMKASKIHHTADGPKLETQTAPLRHLATPATAHAPPPAAAGSPFNLGDGRPGEPPVGRQEKATTVGDNPRSDFQSSIHHGAATAPRQQQQPPIVPPAWWSSAMDFIVRQQLQNEEPMKKMLLDHQRDELRCKRMDLEVRWVEARNNSLSIETQAKEQERRAHMEEQRRREDREERMELMNMHTKLMEAFVQLAQSNNKK